MLYAKYIDILMTTLEGKKISRQKWRVMFLLLYFFILGTDLRVGWLDKILVTVVSFNLSFLVYERKISVKKNLVILELTVLN